MGRKTSEGDAGSGYCTAPAHAQAKVSAFVTYPGKVFYERLAYGSAARNEA